MAREGEYDDTRTVRESLKKKWTARFSTVVHDVITIDNGSEVGGREKKTGMSANAGAIQIKVKAKGAEIEVEARRTI